MQEYWQYDPTGDYLVPPLKGLQLVDGNYWPIPVRDGGDGTLIGASAVLGLELRVGNGQLHLYDPSNARALLTYAELDRAHRAAEDRAAAEAAQRQVAEDRAAAAEARIAELEARLRDGG